MFLDLVMVDRKEQGGISSAQPRDVTYLHKCLRIQSFYVYRRKFLKDQNQIPKWNLMECGDNSAFPPS